MQIILRCIAARFRGYSAALRRTMLHCSRGTPLFGGAVACHRLYNVSLVNSFGGNSIEQQPNNN